MKTEITHIYICVSACVFGVGNSRDSAIQDAANWMEPADGGPQGSMTEDEAAAFLDAQPDAFQILDTDHPEFDSYLRNQGGYEQIDGKWYDPDEVTA